MLFILIASAGFTYVRRIWFSVLSYFYRVHPFCCPLPKVHDLSYMAGKPLLILWSQFSSSFLLPCWSMSNTVCHRIRKGQCEYYKIVPTWVLEHKNWGAVNLSIIYITFSWHVLAGYCGVWTIILSQKRFKWFYRLWTVFKNSAVWHLMSFLYLGFLFRFRFSL